MPKKENDHDIATSPNPADLKRQALKDLLPEAFTEGRIDVAALKRALGEESVVEGGERYRLDWVGKSEAYKVLQAPTTATLRPRRGQSVNFDTASHVFIEGENLETLKVLQKAYFGKVKLIYIDPPYNTGNDHFVYPDRFQESKEDYLKRINELDDDGSLMREGFFRKNSRESGHYHSNWLSMMLPRLYIARNLLHEQGVIFVSCDDHEVHNLRCLMDEIFGAENFVATVIWQKVYSPKNTARHFSEDHDFILVYARNADLWTPELLPRSDEMQARYGNEDNDSRGPWKASDLSARNFYSQGTYSIKCPSGRVIDGPPPGMYWRVSKKKFEELDADGRIWWGVDGNNTPAIKRFLSEVKQGKVPQTLWAYKEVGHTQKAKKELISLVEFPNSDLVFDTPKPTQLIRRMLQLATTADEPEIVMDFFAGSGTTLEAVLRQNAEDDGHRQCILVQLPEPLDKDNSEFSDIAQVARTRIRAVLDDLRQSEDLVNKLPEGEGFQAYSLAPSNFRQWRGEDIETGEELAEQVKLFTQSEKDGAEAEAVLHELLLKLGYELTTPIEFLEIAGHPVQAIDQGKVLFVLEGFTEAMIDPLIERKPEQIVTLDSVFQDSDQLKSNLSLQCRDAGIRFTCL
ncbi:site-specific DNA-methyltransferase [Wenzhouxiangella sp. AB-CW3]|uniref:site-specific DNA-methyltransferase n=1 Tax=Wenzhouxiangella sp. AB-CW3 TaxID=2771012 RepID=UPI00168AADEB|nr:site-specific DNA-methyltransferase [Wenzhouxiangella sp. AB-CW3]QOC22345.1 site-specific DNA-methyltransferase [Wenzhouxiangella sp. AB-CW3]